MAKTKYGKYIVTKLTPPKAAAPWSPPNIMAVKKGRGGRLFYLDSNVVPGAFYLECAWVMPPPPGGYPESSPRRVGVKPHTHKYDEVLCFFGTNPEDFYDLGGEVELWLGDEKHIITKTCIVFVPKGLKHCPLIFRRVDRPIFHFTSGPAKIYL